MNVPPLLKKFPDAVALKIVFAKLAATSPVKPICKKL
jgi:hypothetical protein